MTFRATRGYSAGIRVLTGAIALMVVAGCSSSSQREGARATSSADATVNPSPSQAGTDSIGSDDADSPVMPQVPTDEPVGPHVLLEVEIPQGPGAPVIMRGTVKGTSATGGECMFVLTQRGGLEIVDTSTEAVVTEDALTCGPVTLDRARVPAGEWVAQLLFKSDEPTMRAEPQDLTVE